MQVEHAEHAARKFHGEYRDEVLAAVESAISAGEILLSGFRVKDKDERLKGERDPVTRYDVASEKRIKEILGSRFPDYGFLGEEGEGMHIHSHNGHGREEHSGEKRFVWIVDPLDGTVNYSHNYPFWCVSIALWDMARDVPLVGVIYDPTRDEIFYSARGMGAFLNENECHVSERKDLGESVVCTGFPYSDIPVREANVENVRRVLGEVMGVRRDGAAALDLAYVACGRLDGFWEMRLHPWDLAAGVLLVEEAGGRVSGIKNGFDLWHGTVVATNGHIHERLIRLLTEP